MDGAVDRSGEKVMDGSSPDKMTDMAIETSPVDTGETKGSDGVTDQGIVQNEGGTGGADAYNLMDAQRAVDGSLAVDGSRPTDAIPPSAGDLWSVRMADSVLKRYPNATKLNSIGSPNWNYTQGFTLTALDAVYRITKNQKYWNYVVAYYDGTIDGQGKIGGGYSMDEYSLDLITPGRALRIVLAETAKEKFRTALQTLRSQLRNQPRNSVGGFWHKKRYPNQMWLDSVYMGPLFHLQYGLDTKEQAAVDEAILQFTLLQEHTRDTKTGLYFHGWDESRKEKWSNPTTGTSASFWGRGVGWYAMALVDVLESLPESHPKRPALLAILTELMTAIRNVADPQSGVWFQVLDQGSREGNYLESSASCMLCYAVLKSARLGYVDETFRELGRRSFDGIIKQFIRVQNSGEVTITNGCLGAGLGPDPLTGNYRDGSFTYYATERKGDNATQAVPAFILASLEYELSTSATQTH
jgi:unsaturated rhamnogalacturonyl hydrolase